MEKLLSTKTIEIQKEKTFRKKRKVKMRQLISVDIPNENFKEIFKINKNE